MASLSLEAQPITRHFARHIVQHTASDEMEFFDELAQEYFADPTPPDLQTPAAADPLSFGLEGIFAAATPAALAMVSAAVTYIAHEVVTATQEQAATHLVGEIKKRFNPKSPDVALTKAQLNHVYQVAVKEAMAFGMKKQQAEKMARALAGTLVLPPP